MKKEELINNNSFFEGISPEDIDLSEDQIEDLFFNDGSVIFRENSPADKVYFLASGEVNLLDNKLVDRTSLITILPNDFFGFEAVIRNSINQSTAIATRQSFVFAISSETFKKIIKSSEKLQSKLNQILRTENSELLALLEGMVDEEQKELNVSIEVSDQLTEVNNVKVEEKKQEKNSNKNPFDRNLARERSHKDRRLERMRRTIIDLDELESEITEEEEKITTPSDIDESMFTDEDRERGYGKLVKDQVVIIVVFLERATMEVAGEFRNYILDTITFGSKKIVVDLSRTEFVDSTFLGVLVASLKKIVSKKGDLRLVFSKEEPLGLLQLTRMDKIFNIYNQLDDALGNF